MNMRGTIESNHSNILSKIETIGRAINILETFDLTTVNSTTRDKFKYITGIYNEMKENYEMEVVGVLSKYYDIHNLEETEHNDDMSDIYGMFITSNNYIGKLSQCMKFVEDLHSYIKCYSNNKDDKSKSSELIILIKKFKISIISTQIAEIKYDICVCGGNMKLFPNSSELVCIVCGEVSMLYGTVFEDMPCYNQEGQSSRHGYYDPSRHCKFWVYRIQAKENTEIPKTIVDQLTYCINRDGIKDCRRLLCSQLRVYLKETHNTEYNDHVPLIRKIITGIAPPQLASEELRNLYNLFDKSVNSFDTVKPCAKSNTMYYPYIIYKILDLVVDNGLRKKKILECIHLQSRETLITNDNIWESICKITPGLMYRPTDSNDQMIDN